ncbi:3-isopropylmalate dehydratase small subunit [Parvularcula sp. LCG005]|uniref:3-isopropylmalate dehydratase small subunit n=1 Tax=Parvularcula sp. LCG005 TaxID=3078805 RepID=UPI002942C18D|nr:3-isopropylmalate dehydratase small subunit [Parvularcula sp. LCG005]WOI53109.1 3-isopropylmalate dehydratase small subunit [Parvularcula sp. LCG005]
MSNEPFTVLTSRTLTLPQRDIDTDQIIPARFLTTTSKDGLGESAFYDWRFDGEGRPKADNPFRAVDFDQQKILVAGDNFGCGSSREHAPWALSALGLKVIVSTSFGDIFRSNALKNGVLTVEVPADIHAELMASPGREMSVDLEAEELRFGNHVVSFATDPFARRCMLEGTDPLGMLVAVVPEIEKFEKRTGR